jgi:SAM-dependent methyltransferase
MMTRKVTLIMSHEISTHHEPNQADPHNHNHTTMQPQTLALSDRFFEPIDRQIIQWLNLAPGSRVLDAGCGGGGMTRLLAEAVGPTGRVVGLDANPVLLEFDREAVKGTDLVERIKFQEGDVRNLPFEEGSFDLVWCSRVIHGLPDQLAGVRELRRVVRPGGRVVIREGGLRMQCLPSDLGIGEVGLEGRLHLARSKWFASWRTSLPAVIAYPFGWSHMLSEAGLSQVAPKSFLHEFASPLETHQQAYLEGSLSHELKDQQSQNLLSVQDTQTLAELLDKHSSHYVFDRDDLHGILVETIYVGWA